MLFGNREPRSLVARRRGAFLPKGEGLENRLLMAIDIGGTTPPVLPNFATVPYGVALAGNESVGGAGFSVTDVGDLTGSGYDDFVVGGPTVTDQGGQLMLGVGNNATAYLIFGSRTTNAGAISDWLLNTPVQRVGDLSQLGNTPTGQQNPVNGAQGYPFAGIKFVTSQEPGSQLGASVAAAGRINGLPAFLIGAPGARDVNNGNDGTGRAYLIYGGQSLLSVNTANNTVDLDNTAQNSGVNFVTFVNLMPGARTGRAVAGAGDVITDGVNDIAIGAPGATANGLAASGEVFLISGTTLPLSGTVLLNTVGQPGGRAGVQFTGAASGDQVGFSLAAAGSVSGALTTANQRVQDLLIGSPQINSGPGAAYLVYGSPVLGSFEQNIGGLAQIQVSRIGTTGTTGVPGLAIRGANPADLTGWSVASAGDVNGDGLADILIGSPGAGATSGRVDLLYGASATGTPLLGQVTLGQLPGSILNATFTGGTIGDLAGFSVSQVGKINLAENGNPFLIGAPGFNQLSGTVYLIPSNPSLEGVHSLGAAESDPAVAATQFTITTPGSPSATFFGASVSGRPTFGQRFTADGDLIADFIVGAPGYAATSTRGLDGGVFIFEGAAVRPLLRTPVSSAITTQIGVEQPFGPFVNIDPTTPADLKIYVFSNAAITPPFDPVTDIDPKTIVVNGVAYPNATIAKDPVDENKDGIEDAIITINPRANLGLTASTTSLTITGRTLPASLNANKRFSGTAQITVLGSGGGTGGGAILAGQTLPIGFVGPTSFVPPFGPDRYVPPLSSLSRLGSYKPIPLRVALRQYQAQPGYNERLLQYFHPTEHRNQFGYSGGDGHQGHRTTALGSKVFTRGKFKRGKHFTFTHEQHVVPTNLKIERL
ncbi:MAG: hypothetical protein NVSMB9_15700 [Isosphaeraceae bacterium]